MTGIKIIKYINNLEIISKIMNSVAVKCGCLVKYNAKSNSIEFTGDDKYKRVIVEEALSYLPREKDRKK